jgi:hypothetical protein
VGRNALVALVVVFELVGWVWILQGIGVLPGSFMTGQMMWAAIGAALVMFANVLLLVVIRSRRV